MFELSAGELSSFSRWMWEKKAEAKKLLVSCTSLVHPQYGLYSAFMGGFIYTLLGTSKDVTLGPTAIMSLLCFSVVGGQPQRAVLLSLLCGLIQAAMALLRLGEEWGQGS